MLQDKLSQLRDKYQLQEDQPQLDQWEQEVSQLLLVSSIAESEAIQKLVAELTREVDAIDTRLLTENTIALPEYVRDLLFEKKWLYLRVISYFDTSRLKDLEKEIDSNLHNLI